MKNSYVREVLTIHTNHNHTHTHTHTHIHTHTQSKSRAAFFDPILLHCVSLQLKFYSEYSLSAKVIVKKNKSYFILTYFKIITHSHLPKFAIFLKNSTKTFFFNNTDRTSFHIIWNANLFVFYSRKKLFHSWDLFSNRKHTKISHILVIFSWWGVFGYIIVLSRKMETLSNWEK